jgi:ATP/maltotriose-dependent transcriptional regulator MalT
MPASVKPSRLLRRLEGEIVAARTPAEADCRRAERAAYLARLGRFDEARRELDSVRRKHDRNPLVDVSAWSNFAEGILNYFDNMGASNSDRVQRAYALSSAAGNRDLQATCAAWLAQWDYAKHDMEALALHVTESLNLAGPQHHAARARASLVAAQALHLGGRMDLARVWYRRSKDHATSDGDDVTISALMYNMACLHMMTMRQVVLTGQGDVNAGQHALMSAESNAHFDAMVGDSSWSELKPILRAQIVSMKGDPAQALTLYDENLNKETTVSRLQAYLWADKAWCHAQLDQVAEANFSANEAIASLSSETQVDDRAAAHSRLAQVFGRLGAGDMGRQHESLSRDAWSAHRAMQARIVSLLGKLAEDGRLTS